MTMYFGIMVEVYHNNQSLKGAVVVTLCQNEADVNVFDLFITFM